MGRAGEEMPRTPSHTRTYTHLLPPQTYAEDHQVPTAHQTGPSFLIYLPWCLDSHFIVSVFFPVSFFNRVYHFIVYFHSCVCEYLFVVYIYLLKRASFLNIILVVFSVSYFLDNFSLFCVFNLTSIAFFIITSVF